MHNFKAWHNQRDSLDDEDVLTKREAPGGTVKINTKPPTTKKEPVKTESHVTLVQQKLDFYADKVKQRQDQKASQSETFNDVLGYMPLRGDFDVEYDNEAELFLAEMEFNGN